MSSPATSSSHVAPSGSGRWTPWLTGVLLALVFGPTIVWLWERWTMSVWHHAHGPLILAAVGYLIWEERGRLRDTPVSANGWGFGLLIPALALHALDTGMHTQIVSAVALLLALPGLSLLFLGTGRTKVILVPLLLLFFTLPIPLALTEPLHNALRNVVAVSVSHITLWLLIPVSHEGTTFQTAAGSVQIADACSGFATLYAAVAVACLTAYLSPDPRRRVLVLLAAAPIAIAANVLRVLLLLVLIIWQGLGILDTVWHTISGLFTFAIALPIIFWLGRVPPARGGDAS